MTSYPNSPYSRARRAVDAFEQGALTPEGFVAQLDALAGSVEGWGIGLDGIRSEGFEEGLELIEDARESLRAVAEGLDLLREYAVSRSSEAAREALDLIAEASEFLVQLLDVTEQNMEDLEDQR